jgi:hypothetical protein
MVDIAALMKVLPVSALEPDWVASLGGFIDVPKDRWREERIGLLEPPAGQRVPYIEPVDALEKLLRRRDIAPEDAKARAVEAVARMKDDVAEDRWVNFFDDLEPESPDCLPVPDFVAWLRDERRRINRLASDLKLDGQGFKELASEEMLVQAKLDEAFDGDLRIADKESLDGFFALRPGPGLFRRLHESFDYVTEVLDNPAGLVRITGSSRFDWRSYGELMEWYHSLRGSDRFGAWSALTPFFVCGNTGRCTRTAPSVGRVLV